MSTRVNELQIGLTAVGIKPTLQRLATAGVTKIFISFSPLLNMKPVGYSAARCRIFFAIMFVQLSGNGYANSPRRQAMLLDPSFERLFAYTNARVYLLELDPQYTRSTARDERRLQQYIALLSLELLGVYALRWLESEWLLLFFKVLRYTMLYDS